MSRESFRLHLDSVVGLDPEKCWPWPGTVGSNGYGYVRIDQKMYLAHRMIYECLVGEIPKGLTLDHLCMNRPCVNPEHLDPCTRGENSRRSPNTPTGKNVRATECPQGHRYEGDNLYYDQGKRKCRTCVRARNRRWQANNPMTPERHARRMELQRLRRSRA